MNTAVRSAIRKAKSASWAQLISAIDSDPWGLPYKLVMGKLRRSSPVLSETLDAASLNELLNSLFPTSVVHRIRPEIFVSDLEMDDIEVDIAEVIRVVRKRPSRDAAPGPDNLKALTWKKAPSIVLIHLANLFTLCLKTGIFPKPWKRAMLVLIPKGPTSSPGIIKARPIYLLDEVGKTLERVIADRINSWLVDNTDCLLSGNQYGFRTFRSTVDALFRVRELTHFAMDGDGYAIAALTLLMRSTRYRGA